MDEMTTPDGRYLIVRGRLWRKTNPNLSETDRETLVDELMKARRSVAKAMRGGNERAERAARRVVHRTKVALGERGPVWWTDGAPDFNRRLVRNSPYREWYETAKEWESTILAMLEERAPATICPSEVARRVEPKAWRSHMDAVRDAARRLARQGAVVISQRGRTLDPVEPPRGPIRIGLGAGVRTPAP